MKFGMKRSLSLLLCLVMLLGVLPVVGFADGECAHPSLVQSCKEQTTCPDCGNKFGPYPHVTTPATCKDPETCTACGATFGTPTDEHKMVAATCQAPQHCSVCSKSWGTVADHDYAPATCLAPKTCKNCSATDGVPSTEHSYSAATCSVPATCSVCMGTTGGVNPENHVNIAEATCQAPKHCKDCGDSWGTVVSHDIQPATCLAKAKCKNCTATFGEVSTEHRLEEATCQSPAKCKDCGDTFGTKGDHKIKAATCQAKATCTVCNATFGSIGTHSFASSGLCTVCGGRAKAYGIVSGPSSMTLKTYYHDVSGVYSVLPSKITYNTQMGNVTAGLEWTCDYFTAGVSETSTFSWKAVGDALSILNMNGVPTRGTIYVTNVSVIKTGFTIAGLKLTANVDGYAVNLHQVSDKNLEKILDKPEKDGTIKLVFNPVSWLNYIHTVRLPADLVEEIADAADDSKSDVKALEIVFINGRSVKLDAEALDDLAEKADKAEGKFVAIILVNSNSIKTAGLDALTKAQKKDLGERPSYAFSAASGKEIFDDVAGKVEVQIPYKLRNKEKADGLKVYSIAEDGKRTAVKTSYDEKTDKVAWEAGAKVVYVIEYEAAKK